MDELFLVVVITFTASPPCCLLFKHFCLLEYHRLCFSGFVHNFHSKRALTAVDAFRINYTKRTITASTDARVHPLPCRPCSCSCTGARAEPVQPRAAQGPASLTGSLWLPTPVPAAALPPPDTHPCPLLVLLMLLGANIQLIASGNPGIKRPAILSKLGVLPARSTLRSLFLGREGD